MTFVFDAVSLKFQLVDVFIDLVWGVDKPKLILLSVETVILDWFWGDLMSSYFIFLNRAVGVLFEVSEMMEYNCGRFCKNQLLIIWIL